METSAEKSTRNSDVFEFFPESCESVMDSSTCSSQYSSSDSSAECSSPAPFGWPIRKSRVRKCPVSEGESKTQSHDSKVKQLGSPISEVNMMKERFAKLLLGEDMSGNGQGVSSALAISNAITNLCATVFGQLWRLEPLSSEKKSLWRREMEWLLCVSDHIVELIPSWRTFADGRKLEVMTCRQRSDIYIHLPALRKLDDMLLEILDSFSNTEFWYIDQGITARDADGSASFRKPIQRHEDKWWLPVPRVPHGGLPGCTRKQLNHKRECASQILKAAMAINSMALAEMEVPESYMEELPKNGRACLGDFIHRYITSDQFSSECLLDCLDLSTEHIALEIADRVEASIYVWRRRLHSKHITNTNRSAAKSSWEMVKDLMLDGDKRGLVIARAEGLLLCLRQRFPGLTQTTLDTSKIQYNKDVGKSILESYSRVLESLAFNIVARIDDLIYVDDLTRHSHKLAAANLINQKRSPAPYSVSISGTPRKTAFITSNFLPALPSFSPAKGERIPFLSGNNNNNKPPRRGFGVKRALTNYLGCEAKAKICGNPTTGLGLVPNRSSESPAS
ncbi:hypothetical protein Vadar_000137 [Vaccinium darrowii]|uniref:Uncharacterized protein n=1 Tax=Vaccinium darrowii TaxID=229202 RepID=A0ACB7XEY5_9ERIC|nr:hypothetical protein Vadar_000137 [Vaccinium darrowii]